MCGLGELFGARSTLEQVLGAYSSFLGIFLADCKDLVDFMFRSGEKIKRRKGERVFGAKGTLNVLVGLFHGIS